MGKTNDIVVKENSSLHSEEWYVQLVEDCKAIKIERGFNAAMELIRGNWELGQRISQENQRMERSEVYGKKVVETLADDLGKSSSHIWRCVQVYQFYGVDDFDQLVPKLPEGKNVTWTLAVKGAGIEKDAQALKEKTSFKIDKILNAFKVWIVSNGTVEEKAIDKAVKSFKEELLKGE